MRPNRSDGLTAAGLAFLAALASSGAFALPSADVSGLSDSALVRVQDVCGTIGNCGIGMGGINTIPRHTITPDIGRFDPGHDNRFGRYRYEPPDQEVNVGVQKVRPAPIPASPRYTGTRTLYRIQNLSADHVDWCYARYRSYRAKDNTYQPDTGPRKVCVSPFS